MVWALGKPYLVYGDVRDLLLYNFIVVVDSLLP